MKALHINGNDLTLEAVREVADLNARRPVLLDPDAREAVDRARAVVDMLVANNKLSYAITTSRSTWSGRTPLASASRWQSPRRAP